jgi:hypothetical protein
MGCTEHGVQPSSLRTLNEVIVPCTHITTSLLKANEAKSRECGEFEKFPLGHSVLLRFMLWYVTLCEMCVVVVGLFVLTASAMTTSRCVVNMLTHYAEYANKSRSIQTT